MMSRGHSNLRAAGIVVAGLVLGIVALLAWPAHPHLRDFSPRGMATLEAGMWRDYYNGHHLALGGKLVRLSREEFGFSRWDSLRLAALGAVAAAKFRRSHDRAEAFAVALPPLVTYYGIIRRASSIPFDPERAARLEVEWWVQRRESVPPGEYARTIAALGGTIYGVPAEALQTSANLRARAMAFRDARRDGRMTEADWQWITVQLTDAYTAMKAAVQPPP